MPEGDSLCRVADRVRVLEGQVVSVETPHPRAALPGLADRLDGRRLEGVEAVGKNLLLTFEGGLVLRSHLRMKGRWHVRRVEETLTGRPWLVLRGDEWKPSSGTAPPGGRSTVGWVGRAGSAARGSAPGRRVKRREWRTGVQAARQERG